MRATVSRTAGATDQAGGVEGNSRLTAVNGMVLLGLLAVEGVTVLDVEGLITLHIYLGLLLVGPVLLKCASTGYRFLRYYTGAAPYVRKGPPHPILRMLGPLVVLSSVAVLGTGIALVYTGPAHREPMLTLHQASFVVWFAVTTGHVLGHLIGAGSTTWRELRDPRLSPAARRRRWRALAVALALVAGVGLATAVLPSATALTSHHYDGFERHGGDN
ncbi:hypothetical protein M6B22_05520 [Jatrophihabitans cynanchi]|uniref:Cytochrome b561 bacterial/Ni-hydrogenase domain-containing protein n=1 Tax=Jatrophihabitans cynanchi TaxID=2944128 RepID=A0ABY7K051_9ACTN|nr:hypothetical protein [Jatrophihabitans sp. SB3-54]WAX58223.1 hypothetical protein M6B22_05520 [Jatrophihabitans sp. SB3-54]